jgi:hypothetical protein
MPESVWQAQQQQQLAAAQLAEQTREFNVQQQQAQQTLANTQAQEAANQAQVDQQAALTNEWQTGRAAEQATAAGDINNAFASFTPAYYDQHTKDYLAYYQPQVDKQYASAENAMTYGLARTGNLQSQTAASQTADLAGQKATEQTNLNNQAISSTSALQSNVASAKSNLMSQATSDATLGSPITPGSADAITAQFNNTSATLANLSNTAGDTVTSLQATPQYSSLGSLFGSAAGSVGSAVTGNNYYNNLSAFNSTGGIAGSSNPTSSSGKVN